MGDQLRKVVLDGFKSMQLPCVLSRRPTLLHGQLLSSRDEGKGVKPPALNDHARRE